MRSIWQKSFCFKPPKCGSPHIAVIVCFIYVFYKLKSSIIPLQCFIINFISEWFTHLLEMGIGISYFLKWPTVRNKQKQRKDTHSYRCPSWKAESRRHSNELLYSTHKVIDCVIAKFHYMYISWKGIHDMLLDLKRWGMWSFAQYFLKLFSWKPRMLIHTPSNDQKAIPLSVRDYLWVARP